MSAGIIPLFIKRAYLVSGIISLKFSQQFTICCLRRYEKEWKFTVTHCIYLEEHQRNKNSLHKMANLKRSS